MPPVGPDRGPVTPPAPAADLPAAPRSGGGWPSPWIASSLLIGLLVATPLAIVFWNLFFVEGEVWGHIAKTVLPGYLWNSLWLCLGVGVMAVMIGVPAAWLVTMCEFPLRRQLEWALLLPMAVPAYIMAYTWTDLLDYAGIVQVTLRDWFGWANARDYWFPEIRSLGGAILVMGFVLYPYVYLTCRAAFLDQSACLLEAGRTLGQGPWACFRRLALPLARPALVAGLSLVAMETLADYGTVDFFAVPSFTVGIYRTWTNYESYTDAAKLAALLLVVVATVLVLEQLTRGRRRYHHTTGRIRPLPRWRLRPFKACLALVVCLMPLLVGFATPLSVLALKAIRHGDPYWRETLTHLAFNSVLVSATAAASALAAGLAVVYAARLAPGWMSAITRRACGLGYAVPGSVIAIAVVIPLAWLDHRINDLTEGLFGWSVGLVFTGSMLGLAYAYTVRFLAVAIGSLDAGLQRIPHSIDGAARSLGAGPWRVLTGIHLPLMRGAVFTAILMVFVDGMKELPATMILRPPDFDTLATRVHFLAGDERLGEASFPALMVLVVGLLPVLVLSRLIARSRPMAEVPA